MTQPIKSVSQIHPYNTLQQRLQRTIFRNARNFFPDHETMLGVRPNVGRRNGVAQIDDKQNYLSGTEWKQDLSERMLSAVDHVQDPKSLEEAEELYDDWIRAPFHKLVAGSLQQTILTRIKERVCSFLGSKRSEALSEIFDSLQNKREPTDTYVRGRFSDSLLSDIVSFGMQKRVAELSTFGLRWMGHYIQRSYLDKPMSSLPQIETRHAAAEIERTINARLSKGDLSVARRARLSEFAEKLAQLGQRLNNQPPQETP